MRTLRNYGWFVIIGLGCFAAESRVEAASKRKVSAKRPPAAKKATPSAESAPAGGSLSSQIQRLATSSRVGGMQVGIRIDLLGEPPTVVYEQKADEVFKPASNQKIVTSAAALSLLPADFTYRTVLGQRGQDLVIIGAGDPATGDGRMAQALKQPSLLVFHKWAEALKAKGITKVAGNLLFDDFIFEQQPQQASTGSGKKVNMQDWYRAPVGGLNLSDNCVEVLMKPGARAGEPAEVSLFPPNTYMHLQNKTKTASRGEPFINRASGDPTMILVSGPVSKGNSPNYAPAVAVADPGMLFATACRVALAGEGIEFAGEVKRERIRAADFSIPGDVETIATHEQKLIDLMWRVEKSSLNVFAEALLKTVGAYDASGRPIAVGSYDTGRAATKKFLTQIGVKPEGYVIDDGSGLSHENRVTPNMIATILRYMNSSPRREDWWSNLAVPGEKEGTLRRRLKGYEGKVFAKTGFIDGVKALSGYVKGGEGRIYVFSVLCNDTGKSKGMAPGDLQDSICKLLAKN